MSWLNNSLNSIKGQLTTLAQEVLAETAGPGDEEYTGPPVDKRTALELLADTQKEKEELDKICNEKENEIVMLRKQIMELQNKVSDSGGGGGAGNITASTSGATSKSPTGSHGVLEDSWCWEPENVKTDNDHSSDSSFGNGNEMVNITLEEVPLGASSKTRTKRAQRFGSSERSPELQQRIQQLEEENKQLNQALEELDSQHNLAMQNVLELKTELQEKLTTVTSNYEALKKEHAEKFINGELELARVKKQLELLERENKTAQVEQQSMQQKIDDYVAELKKATEEMADLQLLLEKRNNDNVELIEKVKDAECVAVAAETERNELQQKVEQLIKEVEEAKKLKEKKTSESSTSSTGKQSEDEFIVVREGDANSSGPATPPSKEELKVKIVQLENRVSELTLENGSLALKLQEREMEKELAVNVLHENVQALQASCAETEAALNAAKERLEEQQEQLEEFKERAAEAIIAQKKLEALSEEKGKIELEIEKMKESLKSVAELEKRLLYSEQEKEALQVEMQNLRSSQERVAELEGKVQKLILENQQLKLNAEAETETLNNSAELEDKLKSLTEENESLRSELEAIAQAKFRQAIAEEKQEVTDLDADEDEPFSMEKLRELLNICLNVKPDLSEDVNEELEKACKALHERLWKTKSLEKSLTQMSEEIMDLQDSKLVWDHEKKTLEADISQYILQCDELMKNNEILLNELENYKRNKLETIHEHNEESILHLETQLEECTTLNQSLEQEYAELNKKNDELEREKQELTEQLRAAQQSNESLMAKENDLKLQLETLELEKSRLLLEMNEWRKSGAAESDSSELLKSEQEKTASLESQLARLSKDHADLVAAMHAQKAALKAANKKREETEKALSEQEMIMAHMSNDVKTFRDELNGRLDELTKQNEALKQELNAKDIVADSLKAELQTLQERLNDFDALVEAKLALETELAESKNLITQLQNSIKEQITKAAVLEAGLKEQSASSAQLDQLQLEKETLEKEYTALKQNYETKTAELNALQKTTENASCDTVALTRIAQLEAELLATADLQKRVEALNFEKNEMIKALQQKHAENMQYYMEIQRLTPIVQQLQQQVANPEPKPCEKCPALEQTLSDMRKELEKQHDQINFLKEKSDILTTNLLTEQTNQKLVQQEKAEVEEQNAAIRKDLERLREHLLEIEDLHTQETVEMQRELEEAKANMLALQEEVAKSSNAYTSVSIRANQHAETLQAQYALVVQQRDELVNKLSLAEDRELKNQAALCNLQCALEQFQNDKENDIKAATQRIRKELQQELQKQTQLENEIAALNQQLADANQGLRAAARLSDQLELCQQTIAALREEVETLKQQNVELSEKLNTSESSQTDKIDKNLIKSLLIGYVVSGNPNDKNQVLRMISSVLDFTASESDRVGLNKQHSSWLGNILGGGGASGSGGHAAHSKDNLMQAFVEFLEQESQPKVNPNNMPNLLNITQTPATSATSANSATQRRTSTGSNSGSTGASTAAASNAAPIPIQPLLMHSNVLDDFAPTRNSSSILKDILSDS